MVQERIGELKYSHIFSPKKIGRFEARNRVKYAACSVSNFNTRDGFITDREYARMEVVAQTGAGVITNQGAYPDPKGEGKAYFRQLSITDDKYIPGFKRIADLIHQHGAIAIQQILHGGRYGGIDLDYCVQPSAVPQTLRHFRRPQAMTKAEIKRCIEDHALAARRAMEAGFDGIEITSFMGYLLSNFNSKFTNVRRDEYGGSVQNRGRFMCDLIQAVRETIGENALLIVRLNGVELMDEYGGNTPEECLGLIKLAEQAGVDMISVVVGWHESRTGALARDLSADHWLYLAEAAKQMVKVPIAFGPCLNDPLLAEKALAERKFDFWEVCRPFLADPELLHKVAEDRLEDTRPCVGGLLCLARMFRNLPYQCTVNPRLGHEAEPGYQSEPVLAKKRVMVIGGGPAGMECAVTSARRGHEVILFEKSGKLGGQLNAAAKEMGGGGRFLDLVRYYEKQMKDVGVEIHLQTEVTPGFCAKLAPDVAIVATGAGIDRPFIAGCDGENVVSVYDVLEDKVHIGDRAVVWSGERAGLVAAEHLASQGKRVSIVEEAKSVARDVIATFRWRHYAWVKELNIKSFTSTRVKGLITDQGVLVEDTDGNETLLPADTVVIAGPRRSRQELVRSLEFVCDELYLIGDAVKPGSLHNAVRDGYLAGVRI